MAALGDLQMFGRSLDRAFLVLLTVGTVTYAWIAVYHLLLHPLRSVVRVGPNEISFADPAALREIYTSDGFTKEESFYGARTMFHEDHLFSFRHPEAHRQRRKLLSRGFSQASMLDFEPNIDTKIHSLLDQWAARTRSGGSIDIYPWCHWLGFDIVYNLMFDRDPKSVDRGQAHEVMKYIRAWRPTPKYKEFVPGLKSWGVYCPGQIGGHFRAIRDWKQFATALITDVRRNEAKTPFLRHALTEIDGFLGRPLTDGELAEESMGGMFGGSGTTANTFLYIVWAVARDAAVKKKLQDELRGAFPLPQGVPSQTECSKLLYTQAVITETLRLYPTIVATLPRTASREMVIHGTAVPKGTTVGIQNYTVHRDPRAFPEPEVFLPERWLETTTEEEKNWRKDAFNPFSVGSRRCIGLNLAQMELSKLTAAFFRRFEVEIDDCMCEDDMRLFDSFNAGPAGAKLWLRLKQSGA